MNHIIHPPSEAEPLGSACREGLPMLNVSDSSIRISYFGDDLDGNLRKTYVKLGALRFPYEMLKSNFRKPDQQGQLLADKFLAKIKTIHRQHILHHPAATLEPLEDFFYKHRVDEMWGATTSQRIILEVKRLQMDARKAYKGVVEIFERRHQAGSIQTIVTNSPREGILPWLADNIDPNTVDIILAKHHKGQPPLKEVLETRGNGRQMEAFLSKIIVYRGEKTDITPQQHIVRLAGIASPRNRVITGDSGKDFDMCFNYKNKSRQPFARFFYQQGGAVDISDDDMLMHHLVGGGGDLGIGGIKERRENIRMPAGFFTTLYDMEHQLEMMREGFIIPERIPPERHPVVCRNRIYAAADLA